MLGYGPIGKFTIGQAPSPPLPGPGCITLGAINFECIAIFLIGSGLFMSILDASRRIIM